MVSTTRLLAWGYLLPMAAILVLALLLNRRTAERDACTDAIRQAREDARVALEASRLADERAAVLQAERDALDAQYDSLLTKITKRRPHAIPPRPRTAPELRESILRATREK